LRSFSELLFCGDILSLCANITQLLSCLQQLSSPLQTYGVPTSFVFLLPPLCPARDVLFSFARPKEKRTKKEKDAHCPIAPRDNGLALRCYPSALLSAMALVFLAYRLPDD
jgi:hypothetical protein